MFAALFVFTCQSETRASIKADTVICLSESLLIAAPLWCTGKRWRWATLLAVWSVSLFLWANILYFRYWHDLIPFASIFSTKSYNGLVFGSIGKLLRPSDIVYFISAVTPTVAYLILRPQDAPKLTARLKIAGICATIIIYAASFTAVSFSLRNIARTYGREHCTMGEAMASRFGKSASRTGQWHSNGLTCYVVNQLISLKSTLPHSLTDDDTAKIENYYARKRAISGTHAPDFSFNRDKNLILIIVESLNAWTVNKSYDGRELAPTLNRLIKQDGTISCLHVTPQVRDGGSSDGQMIYNTGLLPLKEGSAALSFGDNAFPSIAKALAYPESKEIIVEEGYIWNHRATSAGYGYDEILDSDDLRRASISADEIGQDAAAFSMAIQLLEDKALQKPFMLEITTLSMHFPFNDPAVPRQKWIDDISGIEPLEREYLQMTNYFDDCLNGFLTTLEMRGYSDDTIVVIASDHDQITSAEEKLVGNENIRPIVFIALNTGITKEIERTVGQVDIQPTILEIMGRDAAAASSLGISILNEANTSAIDRYGRLHGQPSAADNLKKEAWDVSDLIIRGDYFARRRSHDSTRQDSTK